jgi:hypothetical protein
MQPPESLQLAADLSPRDFPVRGCKPLERTVVHPTKDCVGERKRFGKPLGWGHCPGSPHLLPDDLQLQPVKDFGWRRRLDAHDQD